MQTKQFFARRKAITLRVSGRQLHRYPAHNAPFIDAGKWNVIDADRYRSVRWSRSRKRFSERDALARCGALCLVAGGGTPNLPPNQMGEQPPTQFRLLLSFFYSSCGPLSLLFHSFYSPALPVLTGRKSGGGSAIQ